MELDENEIIVRFRQGEAEKFSELYDAYVRKIYDFVYFRTFHQQTAEDLTSRVFLKALEKLGQFNPNKGGFGTWLYAIARNTIIDHSRTRKIHEDLEEYEHIASSENVQEQADLAIRREQVLKLLENLPEEAKEVVIMRAWDGLSYKEIAVILQKSEGSVKMAFMRAVEKMKASSPVSLKQ